MITPAPKKKAYRAKKVKKVPIRENGRIVKWVPESEVPPEAKAELKVTEEKNSPFLKPESKEEIDKAAEELKKKGITNVRADKPKPVEPPQPVSVAKSGFSQHYNFLKVPETAIQMREAEAVWKDKSWEKIYNAVLEAGYKLKSASAPTGYIFMVFEKDGVKSE